MRYYFQRFLETKKEIEGEITKLLNKRKKNNQLKELQQKFIYFEEHQYLLEQLREVKDKIDDDKLSNIKEDMELFLTEPDNDEVREALR